ncbi:sensor histidine kinase [Stenotrophomonas rhizophila]|uniref:sensor histidine kinase n=1 Tax=Stenotrophomonas rhizophila TaxID=216778 RepID=UPI001E4BB5EE|nr:ATP-binding protein [Stenotrophomonas rhizophila]MCC7634915.1 HAMP domain-containing protein [Stenotrophomonas rhizophila]MCC7664302.1 HAMP domain-containing protein [Stenotrophomonas rhizophila]
MKRLQRFFASMVGRLFVILLLGMSVAAIGATMLASAKRQQEFERQNLNRIADRLQGFVNMLDGNPELRERLLDSGGPSVRRLPEGARVGRADQALMEVLDDRPGPVARSRVAFTSFRSCLPRLPAFPHRDKPRNGPPRERDPAFIPPKCRMVSVQLSDGTALQLALDSPAVAHNGVLAVDPLFLTLLVLAIAVLAYVVARMASAPLQRLAAAAAALGDDLQGAPMPVTGPLEVQRAAEAFNAMQKRLQRHLGERTQMLAAITHDLQTPVTRLRLRLENVADEALRERLVGDLGAMQALIREGLELARSAESAEQRAALDLDSLLESIVEDAAEAGADVRFDQPSGAVLMLRPLAMHRLFSNLVDNAVSYGRAARVSVDQTAEEVVVRIRDKGPGLAEDELEAVFDPFVRLEGSRSRETGGAGLGLTIARALAEKDGARLQLRNHPLGGLEAVVRWPATLRAPGSRPG